MAVGQVGGEDGAPGGAGLDEAHREACSTLDAHQAAPGVDQVDGT